MFYLDCQRQNCPDRTSLRPWCTSLSRGYRGTVSNIHSLSPQVVRQIRRFTESFKQACSKTDGSRYFMNHCQHCGAKLGDFFIHSEPGGAFFPTSPEQANKMILFRINERFDANCGVGYATDDFMDCMQIGEEFLPWKPKPTFSTEIGRLLPDAEGCNRPRLCENVLEQVWQSESDRKSRSYVNFWSVDQHQ